MNWQIFRETIKHNTLKIRNSEIIMKIKKGLKYAFIIFACSFFTWLFFPVLSSFWLQLKPFSKFVVPWESLFPSIVLVPFCWIVFIGLAKQAEIPSPGKLIRAIIDKITGHLHV